MQIFDESFVCSGTTFAIMRYDFTDVTLACEDGQQLEGLWDEYRSLGSTWK